MALFTYLAYYTFSFHSSYYNVEKVLKKENEYFNLNVWRIS